MFVMKEDEESIWVLMSWLWYNSDLLHEKAGKTKSFKRKMLNESVYKILNERLIVIIEHIT